MCLIIRCDKNLPISKKLLENFHQQNDDGWGMMWIEENQIKVLKNPSNKFAPLWEAYQSKKEFNPVIHVRYRTHGNIDHDNTHPFYCGYGIYLMHNGVVGVECNNNEKSDTWHMVENYIKPLFAKSTNPHKMIRHPKFQEKFSKMLGNQNRIVMGDRGGFVFFNLPIWHKITNEKTGCKGMLVSNTYAWDSDFGMKRQYNYNTYNYNNYTSHHTTGVVHSNSAVTSACSLLKSEKNQYDMVMFQVSDSLYEDEWHNKWIKHGDGVFAWDNTLNRDDTEEATVIEHKEESKPTLVVPAANVGYTSAEYMDILLKNYMLATRTELRTLVHQEPDDAVNLLHHFLHS